MGSGWLDPRRLLSWLSVLLMAEAASRVRASSTGAPRFPAAGVVWTPTVDCRSVCGLNVSDRCSFIRSNPNCHSNSGYLDYLEGIFCHFTPSLLPLTITLYVLWLLYLFLVLGVTAAKFFCPNLSAIATTLKLSHNVAGVTFLAFGNGAPDIFSALVAFSDPRTASLAIGALFGAGVLVTTVVAGGITILRPFLAASRPFLRDIAFYLTAVFLTFTALYLGRVTLAWALAYLGLYVFYVLTVILCTWIYRWQCRRSLVYSMPGTPELLSDSEEDPMSSNTSSYDYGDHSADSGPGPEPPGFPEVEKPVGVLEGPQGAQAAGGVRAAPHRAGGGPGQGRPELETAAQLSAPDRQPCGRGPDAAVGGLCLLGLHAGPPGLPKDGVLRLLRRHHLQSPGGRGAGLSAADCPGQPGGQVLPAQQSLRRLSAALLCCLPRRGPAHGIRGDSPEKCVTEATQCVALGLRGSPWPPEGRTGHAPAVALAARAREPPVSPWLPAATAPLLGQGSAQQGRVPMG
ncbi:sodium/potassium/calcium exchanger 6, mitochondrial isoform X5 [Heterocephalus glaber]|uniref:Sodium/potassium/calcium exchanger 6, mitochondrial isoform X5 n=1 Tax=Heterocephalus glaber TaxID=10181 RepID=A0AAX6STP0_HETGA|nr:sodium/potassium/calcium exchanger 6, mitochondrial isoform X5 [Heterocephalus glaber]